MNRGASPAPKAGKAPSADKAAPGPAAAAPAKAPTASFGELRSFVDACLRGASQVVFVDDPKSGSLIIVALMIASIRVAFHGVLGLCISTFIATLAFGRKSTTNGLMGYNGMLAGLTFATFPPALREKDGFVCGIDDRLVALLTATTVIHVVAGCVLQGPAFTIAFNICAVGYMAGPRTAMLAAAGFAATHVLAMAFKKLKRAGRIALLVATATLVIWGKHQFFDKNALTIGKHFSSACLHSISQIFLAENFITALLILAAIAYESSVKASLATYGSMVGVMVAVLQNANPEAVSAGLYGYGPALAAMAVGGGIFSKETNQSFGWAILAATLAALLQAEVVQLFQMYNIASPPFTIGANISIMLALAATA